MAKDDTPPVNVEDLYAKVNKEKPPPIPPKMGDTSKVTVNPVENLYDTGNPLDVNTKDETYSIVGSPDTDQRSADLRTPSPAASDIGSPPVLRASKPRADEAAPPVNRGSKPPPEVDRTTKPGVTVNPVEGDYSYTTPVVRVQTEPLTESLAEMAAREKASAGQGIESAMQKDYRDDPLPPIPGQGQGQEGQGR